MSPTSVTKPPPTGWFGLLIFALYALVVLVLLARHEVWRDEVRALNMAREAGHPGDLITHVLVNDGHPALWHTLLWLGLQITDNPVVLKVTAYLVALAFSALFFFCSPFPLAIRVLFLCGFFPLHLYSVVARSYGLSWLFLFLLAREYSRERGPAPWRAGLYLFLLANTNIYGTLCAPAFLLVPLQRTPGRRWDGGIATFGTLLGIGLVAFTVWPNAESITHAPNGQGGVVMRPKTPLAIAHSLAEIVSDSSLWSGFFLTAVDWGPSLEARFGPAILPLLGGPGLWLVLLSLVRWPRLLAAFGLALVLAGGLSRHVYPAGDRQLGVLLGLLLALLWIARARDASPVGRAWMATYVGMALAFLAHAVVGVCFTMAYWNVPYSNSQAAGETIRRHHPEAMLVCEPDLMGESLSYYTSNPVYLVREQRWSPRPRFHWPLNHAVSLRECATLAERQSEQTGRPLLLILSTRVEEVSDGRIRAAYGRNLTVTDEERRWFLDRYEEVAAFLAPVEETYVLYRLR